MQEGRDDDGLPGEGAQEEIIEQPWDGEVPDHRQGETAVPRPVAGVAAVPPAAVFVLAATITPSPYTRALGRRDGREAREERDDGGFLEPSAGGGEGGLEEEDGEAERCRRGGAGRALRPEGGEVGEVGADGDGEGRDGGEGEGAQREEEGACGLGMDCWGVPGG